MSALTAFQLVALILLHILHHSYAILPQDIPGQYALVAKERREIRCPNYITHQKFTQNDTSGSNIIEIFHNSIYHNEAQCEGRFRFPVLEMITGEEFNRNRPDGFAPNQTELEKALIDTNSIFGIEQHDRDCGRGGTLDNGTFVAFVQNATSPAFADLENLEMNFKYMLVYSVEFEDKNRCLYRDNSTKPIEEAGVSGSETSDPSPTVDVETVSDGSCFPSGEKVLMKDGKEIQMKDVEVLHEVRTVNDRSSKIFTFSHRQTNVLDTFVEIVTNRGNRLRISPGHYLWVNGNLIPAGATKVGDYVEGAKGEIMRVTELNRVKDWGKFAPHTLNDELIVGGIRVSTFTTAVHPSLARWLLKPAKMAHNLLGVNLIGGWLNNGAPRWVERWLPQGPRLLTPIDMTGFLR